ncbi:MAG: hypothetical protein AB7U20_14030, partial [Planctomycetaceae bacterium]
PNHRLPPKLRDAACQQELEEPSGHQQRTAQAIKSHTTTRIRLSQKLGLDVNRISPCIAWPR